MLTPASVNWVGVLAGIVILVVLGFLWYGPMTPMGKAWMKAMNVPEGAKPAPGEMEKGLVLMLVGSFLMAYVIGLLVAHLSVPVPTVSDGVMIGTFAWLGFIVPLQLGRVAWEKGSWSLFAVNAAYYLVSFVVIGAVFGVLK
jgi:uncharacterized protein DUF1761